MIRTNSYEEAIQNRNEIINTLQDHNPEVTIFLEQVAPGNSNNITQESMQLLTNFENAIINTSGQCSTEDSKVIPVDMADGWVDTFLADDVHYNTFGAIVIADRYFKAIDLHFER